MVDGSRHGQEVLAVIDADRIIVADLAGEILIEHTKAGPGIKYAGNGRPRGRRPGTRPSPTS